jgi:soluble lytic murein transglycosylase-like protein
LLGCSPSLWASDIPRDAVKYRREITAVARQTFGIDAPVSTLAGQLHLESGWKADALSHVGARGLAQAMPSTAEWFEKIHPGLTSFARYSPAWSIRFNAAYMKWLRDRVDVGDDCETHAFALQAYVGGLGWVQKRQKLSPKPWVCLYLTCRINPGITPANQREASRYPERVIDEISPRYAAAGWGRASCQPH